VSTERVLILDDDDLIRDVLGQRLEARGFDVVTAATLAEARERVADETPDVALLDVQLPDGESTDSLLPELVEDDVPCILITAHGTVTSAVQALRSGASDYIEKPFSVDRLEATLRSTLDRTRLRREVRALRRRSPLAGTVVGSSPAMTEVMELVRKIAPAGSATVLVTGETGSGKGVLARAVHELSPRSDQPFVNVTCSALAETLMESELFGHEKGAFTDARTMKRGLVEVANGGTLFLDEIGELSPAVQSKLLRFIEEKAFRRVGGTRDMTVDVRVVAATNRDLEREVAEGRFREDLYYRLRVLPIEVPPLRHRASDIAPLARHFLDTFNRELGKRVDEIDPEAMELLEAHPWPGNVRELRNAIERAVLLTDGTRLTPDALPPDLRGGGARTDTPSVFSCFGSHGLLLADLERRLSGEALRRAEGNQSEAGRMLGLSRHQVRNRLQKYGVEP